MGVSILVVGSAVVDRVMRVATLPQPGETRLADETQTFIGGKGCNQAVAAARLGACVAFAGAVGQDEMGQNMIENFEREDVSIAHLERRPDVGTGWASILLDPAGGNIITVDLAANGAVTPRHAGQAVKETPHQVLMLQGEIPLESNLAALALSDAIRVWNPAPPPVILADAWSRIHVLTPNEREASLLAGFKVDDVESARSAAEQFCAWGVAYAVVTLGEKGAVFAGPEGTGSVPAPLVQVVDTVGAGDAFNGALAVALPRTHLGGGDLPFAEAVRFAVECASLSVQRMGAQTGLPRRDEVASKIDAIF